MHATLSFISFLENTLNRVESSFIFAFNKASSAVALCLCLTAGLGLWPLRVDLLVACWILRSACSRLFLSHTGQRLLKVREGLRICANLFFLLANRKLEQVLFSSGTDLVKTGLEVFVWSELWLRPILQTNWAGSLAGVFSKNSDGLCCLGAPCLNVRDLVAQIAEARFRLGTFKDWLCRVDVVCWAGSSEARCRVWTRGGWLGRQNFSL